MRCHNLWTGGQDIRKLSRWNEAYSRAPKRNPIVLSSSSTTFPPTETGLSRPNYLCASLYLEMKWPKNIPWEFTKLFCEHPGRETAGLIIGEEPRWKAFTTQTLTPYCKPPSLPSAFSHTEGHPCGYGKSDCVLTESTLTVKWENTNSKCWLWDGYMNKPTCSSRG